MRVGPVEPVRHGSDNYPEASPRSTDGPTSEHE